MARGIGREPSGCLLELAFAADPPSATRLVPRYSNVDEALEEVALGRLGSPPGVLQLLVSLEVPPGADQLESVLVAQFREGIGEGRSVAATDMAGAAPHCLVAVSGMPREGGSWGEPAVPPMRGEC